MNVGKGMAAILTMSIAVDVFDGRYPKLHFVGVAVTIFLMCVIIHSLVKPYGQKQVCYVVMWAAFFNLIDELIFDPTATGANDYVCIGILIIIAVSRYKKYKHGTIRQGTQRTR